MKKILVMMCFCIFSCTPNTMSRRWGATQSINLHNKEVVNVTWKNDSLWILSKPMKPDHIPDIYYFEEKSPFGAIEGTVIIREVKNNVKND